MLLSQLRSLFKAGITEYGVVIVPITGNIPNSIPQTISNIKKQCPTGLMKATVLELRQAWQEAYTFGCGGDQVHYHDRKNGILIEFETRDKALADKIGALDLGNITGGKESDPPIYIVQLVVSHKAIVVPWNEYALVEAEREKQNEEEAKRKAALRELAFSLGLSEEDLNIISERHHPKVQGVAWKDRFIYPRKDKTAEDFEDEDDQLYYDRETASRKAAMDAADFVFPANQWGDNGTLCLYGQISLTMEHARRIIDALGPEGIEKLKKARPSKDEA